jgi:amidase
MNLTANSATATSIAADVRSGTRTASDVAHEHLARIGSLDESLNAFQSARRAGALADAATVDSHPGRETLPLAGVPVAVKDNMSVAGEPVRHGAAASAGSLTAHDDVLVSRLREAGAVVVGTTRMPELAAWAFTSSAAYGPTRNPHDPTLDPGGSSGGAAVAVAAGMAAAAVGTDGGGSIRVPASACGLVGVKPTRGLVPLPGDLDEHWLGLSVAGPIARTVEDAAALLAVLVGDTGLATSLSPGRIRVAWSLRSPSPLGRPDAHQRAAMTAARPLLEEAGHDVRDDGPSYPATLLNAWGRSWLAGIAQDAERLGLDDAALEPRTRTMVRKGRRLLGKDYDGRADAESWTRRAEEWFGAYDVLVTPVTARVPGPAGGLDGKGYLATYLASAKAVPFCQAWNLAGFPAVTVPLGFRDGLPLAVQLVGVPRAERLLLGVAAQLMA